MPVLDSIEVQGPVQDRRAEVLTDGALSFLASLHDEFNDKRLELLTARADRRTRIARGGNLDFLDETREVRDGDWTVAPAPDDLQDRRVEITGPTDRKMMINALNSGAKVFMADLEDANSPTWANVIDGQVNLMDAVRGTIEFTKDDGTEYTLDDEIATLVVRPRGLHLNERHIQVRGQPTSGSLTDFGLYMYHNASELVERGTGPYFYLPKLEHHLEARWWNDVFRFAQNELGIPQGTVKATVLIETIQAAFQMDEILYELRDHSSGLNAGRWDYIFSVIKTFRERDDMVLPDRSLITMTVPFMRAYTELLVATCHRRGAHAMGGMAAFIPNRRDPEVTERALQKVREDKQREASDGCDGTWVAHPDLVPVAMEAFDKVLGDQANQIARQRDDVDVVAADLVDTTIESGTITEDGLRLNVSVGLAYINSWLQGRGAVAINDLMEDTATAEISRSQVWQWQRHGAELDDGRPVTQDLVNGIIDEELAKIRDIVGADAFEAGRWTDARELFVRVALDDDYVDFLTLPGYDLLEQEAN